MGNRKPNCVIIDEIDGAAGGAEATSAIAALLRIVNAGAKGGEGKGGSKGGEGSDEEAGGTGGQGGVRRAKGEEGEGRSKRGAAVRKKKQVWHEYRRWAPAGGRSGGSRMGCRAAATVRGGRDRTVCRWERIESGQALPSTHCAIMLFPEHAYPDIQILLLYDMLTFVSLSSFNADEGTPKAKASKGKGAAPPPEKKGRKRGRSNLPLSRPIICIANDLYAPALRPLREIARLFNFAVRAFRTSDQIWGMGSNTCSM